MSAPRYRAFRFRIPDLDTIGGAGGLGISARGGLDMVDGSDSVRQSLMLLLLTIPGERVMRPEYGCHLHRLVFAPNDDTTAGLAMHYVRSAVEQWERRVEVESVDAGADPLDSSRLIVELNYRIRTTGQRDSLAVTMNMTDEVA